MDRKELDAEIEAIDTTIAFAKVEHRRQLSEMKQKRARLVRARNHAMKAERIAKEVMGTAEPSNR